MSVVEFKNTSGQGRNAIVPPEIRGLNWGAFLFHWFWGCSNNVRIVWLMFIPPILFILPVVLLFKGNEWAWRKKQWPSVAHFQAVQKKWSKWALIAIVSFPFLMAAFVPIVVVSLKAQGYYEIALERLLAEERVASALGSPIEPSWWVDGSANLRTAVISIPLTGTKSAGTGCFYAEKISGEWVIKGLMLTIEETQEHIILVPFQALGANGQALGRAYCELSSSFSFF